MLRPNDFIPLQPAVFQILIALAGSDRHGYSIMQDVTARSGMRLSAGTLYGSIKRMLEQGLIEELRSAPDPDDDDERRRYYRLTMLGRKVAMAEAARFERLLTDARGNGILPARS